MVDVNVMILECTEFGLVYIKLTGLTVTETSNPTMDFIFGTVALKL